MTRKIIAIVVSAAVAFYPWPAWAQNLKGAGPNSGVSLEDRSGGSNPVWQLYPNSGIFRISTGTTPTDILSIIAAGANVGNVGIGTTNPIERLEVSGDVRITGTGYNNPSLILPSAQQHIRLADRGVLQSWPAEGLLGTRLAHNLEHQAGLGDVRIETGGASKYEVQSGTLTFHTYHSAAAGTVTSAAANERMRITPDGNVGIGTTNPAAKLSILEIAGSGNLEFGNSAVGTYVQSYDRGTSAYKSLRYIALDHRFEGSGTERMRIDTSGNVGIGSTNPTAKLEVAGDAKITGGLLADYDSGWVAENTSTNHTTTLTHSLGVYPRHFEVWFSPVASPTSWIYPVLKFNFNNGGCGTGWQEPSMRMSTSQFEMRFYAPGCLYAWYDPVLPGWTSWTSGYLKVLIWK